MLLLSDASLDNALLETSDVPTGVPQDGALQAFTIDQILMQFTHIRHEDRTRPRIDIPSNWQLCDYSVEHHADTPHLVKICQFLTEFGDRNSIRF